jgi:hypothetical protein
MFLSVVAAVLLVGSTANAGTLTAATWKQSLQGVNLTASLTGATCTDTAPLSGSGSRLPGRGDQLPAITCPAALLATGSATGTSWNVSLTMPLFALNLFTSGDTVNTNTMAALGGGATIAGNAGGATMAAPLLGQVTVMNAMHTTIGTTGPSMYIPGMTTFVKLPIAVGAVGLFKGTFSVLSVLHKITVSFIAWNPNTQTFTGLTTMGMALPNVVAMGSFNLAGGAGTVTLVTPSKISIDGPLAQRRTASFTSLKLTYAPEPSTLLLLGAGVVGLVLVGSRKR